MEVKSIQGIDQPRLRKFNKFSKRNFLRNFSRVFKNPIFYLGIILFYLIIFSRYSPGKEGFFISNFEKKQDSFFEQKDSIVFEFPSIVIEENSFKTAAPLAIFEGKALGVLTSETKERKEIIEYLVKEGDTPSQIAEKFDISLETILWANDLTKNSKIKPGQELTILPVSGVIRLVEKGETVSEIARKYKADVSEIVAFNELSQEAEVFAGDLLIIPGGVMPPEAPIQYPTPLASSYFICPIPSPCKITQGLHWYNAIDFSNGKCGEPVFATAGGEIQKTGFGSVVGKYIRIFHPNGVITLYGHLSIILKVPGQRVSQGDIIGYIGNTGYTIGRTGCHLHFEVRGARNPFVR